jgi:hypothetical protein
VQGWLGHHLFDKPAVFHQALLVQMIYHYLLLLTDMLALQGASHELQDVGKQCI